jgi:RNA polymerase sigma-70 factor (ECF subfamily)
MIYKAAGNSTGATLGVSSVIIPRRALFAGASLPMPADATLRIPASLAAASERCWRRAAAPAEWNLTREQFQSALERSVAHRFSGTTAEPRSKAIESYLETLHAADLALACACSAGIPAAWDHFVAQFRPGLYRAARAIVGGSGAGGGDAGARELADSLYANLYGLRAAEGQRKSLFDYYHGRSKLGTWLHAILAQRHLDEIRRTRKMDSLDEPAEEGEGCHEIAAENTAPDPERDRYLVMLQATLSTVLDALAPRDRLRLAYYYAEDLTLAEIGKLTGEHESTVSRQLERTRKELRRSVEVMLREEKKLNEAQLQLCYEYAREEWPFDLTMRLRAAPARPLPARE